MLEARYQGTAPGGTELSRQLDRSRGLDDYVHLSFDTNQPAIYQWLIEGRVGRTVTLEIDTRIAMLKSTLVSDENATAAAAIIGGDWEQFQQLDLYFASARGPKSSVARRLHQAEVLVHKGILLCHVKKRRQ